MKTIFRILRGAGKGPIMLYMALFACFVLVIVNSAFTVATNETLLKIAVALVLGFLAELLWCELERKDRRKGGETEESGIVSFHSRLTGADFERVMSAPGHKIVLNTWIFNNESVIAHLEEALRNSKTTVEMIMLSPDSKHVETRNEEIPGKNVKASIESNKNDIAFFLDNLSPEKQERVKVFEYDCVPRITLYSNNDEAFVGFYWPNRMAVHSPQFFVKGRHGKMAEIAWEYYDSLKKKEITGELLETCGKRKHSHG